LVDPVVDLVSFAFFAILLNEVFYCEVAAANTDDNRALLDLHEDALSAVLVLPLAFPDELELGPHLDWLHVDECGEFLVHKVAIDGLIDENVALVVDFLGQLPDRLVLQLYLVQQVQRDLLGLLALVLHLV